MMDTSTTKTPIHLWIVAGLATLWNAFGCFDYFMTRTRGAAYIESMMPTIDGAAMMAYINGFPIWVSFFWGLGVWAGLAGSILLLMRHRLAVPVLLASMVGAIVGIVYRSSIRSASPRCRWGSMASCHTLSSPSRSACSSMRGRCG